MKPIGINFLVAAVAVIVAGAAGYFLGKRDGAAAANAAGPAAPYDGLIGKAMRPGDNAGKGNATDKRERSGSTASGEAGSPAQNGMAGGSPETISEIFARPGPLERWQSMMQLALTADESERAMALKDLSVSGATDDVDAALAALFLYSREAQEDPEAAIAAMIADNDDEWGSVYIAGRAIMSTWASDDPEAAGAYLLKQSGDNGETGSVSEELVEAVASEWSKQNPQAAFQWALKLDENQDAALEGVLAGWVSRQPREAAAYVRQHAPEEGRSELYEKVAQQWARSDYRAALHWARGLSGEEGGGAMQEALSAWAKEDPKSAAEAFTGIDFVEERDRSMTVIAAEWAKDSPREAADWVLAQPGDANDRKAAIQPILYHWATTDSVAASEWLASQPAGPVTDQAIDGLSRAVVNTDSEAATIWAMATSDEKAREQLVESAGRQWLRENYDAAAAWIGSAALSPEVKEKLLSERGKN